MAQADSDALEHAHVEIDDVPAGQYVGIKLRDALAKGVQRGAFIRERGGVLGHWAIAAIDDQHFVDAEPIERDGQQALALGIGFDIERKHARFDVNVGGS